MLQKEIRSLQQHPPPLLQDHSVVTYVFLEVLRLWPMQLLLVIAHDAVDLRIKASFRQSFCSAVSLIQSSSHSPNKSAQMNWNG